MSAAAEPDYGALFEHSPGLLLVLSPAEPFTILGATNAYLRATLTRREEIVGRGLFEVFPDNPDDPAATGVANLRASLQRVIESRQPDTMAVQKYDVRRAAEEGGGFEERWWSPMNSPVIGREGELLYVLHRVEDVTQFVQLKQSEAEQQKVAATLRDRAAQMEAEVYLRAQQIQETNRKLRDANLELERLYAKTMELDRLKSQFFAAVSHELRTPLTLILGPVERMLAAPDLPASARASLETIGRNGRTLARHVDDLLDAAKLEAGPVALRYVELDLVHLARLSAAHFESFASDDRIFLEVPGAEAIEAQVDPERIGRVLLNLLSNAFKVTPSGGRVRVSVRAAEERVVIEVADSGPGIPPELRLAVFERFRQLEGTDRRRLGGTGLGLAIVRDFVELHRGTVSVDEAPEGGALFRVELPRWAPPDERIHDAQTPPHDHARALEEDLRAQSGAPLGGMAAAPPPPLRPQPAGAPLVLVVEDNRDMNTFLCESLAPAYRVASAADGGEGVRKALELRPDLIVTDLMMPGMSGEDLVLEVRRRPELDATPIVLLTARADDEVRVRLLREGAQDYVTKPFSVEELSARVGNLVARKVAEEAKGRLRAQLEQVSRASMVVSEAVAAMADSSVLSVLRTIASQAQTLTGAELAAVGLGTDPDKPFDPWVFMGIDADLAKALGRAPRPVGLLGLVAREGKVVRHASVKTHPAHIGVPSGHPEIHSLLGAPIRFRGTSVGNLYLCNKRGGGEFDEDDERVVEMLAARAGVAVETARLYAAEGMEKRLLQELTRVREEWASIVAHDLMQPVNSIALSAGVLAILDRKRPGEQVEEEREALDHIHTAARRLSRMINDLRDWAAIEAGHLTVRIAEVELAPLLLGVIKHTPDLAERAAAVLPEGEPLRVLGDRERVEQVLINLVTNALKYADPGTPITCAATARAPAPAGAPREAIVSVASRGAGIGEAELEMIFRRYSRTDHARSGEQKGLGLGLYICRSLVEAQGGRIWAESGGGETTFRFTLPLAG